MKTSIEKEWKAISQRDNYPNGYWIPCQTPGCLGAHATDCVRCGTPYFMCGCGCADVECECGECDCGEEW